MPFGPIFPSDPLGINGPQLEPEKSDFIYIKNTSEQINIKINLHEKSNGKNG